MVTELLKTIIDPFLFITRTLSEPVHSVWGKLPQNSSNIYGGTRQANYHWKWLPPSAVVFSHR